MAQPGRRTSDEIGTDVSIDGDNRQTGVLGFEAQLFAVADQLWTNSSLQPSEYAAPVLALIFLKCTDEARFQSLLKLPASGELGRAVDRAMGVIERANPDLRGALPRIYATTFESATLARLMAIFADIPAGAPGDAFGRIYEYFLGKFAPRALQKGGEYFTPASVVKLIVETVEPYHGRILDPACGSGGMFIQSARFVRAHRHNSSTDIRIFGIEKRRQNLGLARMNLAVHGLSGDIRAGNSYYEDPHDCVGQFDFVLANPPFNQKAVDKRRIGDDTGRFPFGIPRANSGNYLWIQLFYAALNDRGRAGFVMANSASDARGSEAGIRRQLIESGAVDAIVALSPNLFYTVALPVTLWFLDRGKAGCERADRVLFIDARSVYRQVDRTHRDLAPAQVEFLANIVRLYRGDQARETCGSQDLLDRHFPGRTFRAVPGLCRAAPLAEIAGHDWSLNPGRYIEIACAPESSRENSPEGSPENSPENSPDNSPERAGDGRDVRATLRRWQAQLHALDRAAHSLEESIHKSLQAIVESV